MEAWGPVERLAKTLELFESYRHDARKCGDAGACLAGCVLLASALEAALLAMVQCFPQDVERAARMSHSKEMLRPPDELGLSQLLEIARMLHWLPSSGDSEDGQDPAKAQVGDYVDVIRAIRNLLHPSIYMKEFYAQQVDRQHLDLSFKVLDEACASLASALEDAKARLH